MLWRGNVFVSCGDHRLFPHSLHSFTPYIHSRSAEPKIDSRSTTYEHPCELFQSRNPSSDCSSKRRSGSCRVRLGACWTWHWRAHLAAAEQLSHCHSWPNLKQNGGMMLLTSPFFMSPAAYCNRARDLSSCLSP